MTLSPITIVFAEDHLSYRQLLIPCLQDYNIFTLGEASDGYQLLKLLKRRMPDVLLLDIEMPGMNGIEALQHIRVAWPKLRVVVLTTYDLDPLCNQMLERGAKGYLTKNTDLSVIAQTIREVHENSYRPPTKKPISGSTEPKFSKRETEMIPLIVNGDSNKQIADKMNIGNKAVEAHKRNMYRKTNTQSVAGFISYLFKKGLNLLK